MTDKLKEEILNKEFKKEFGHYPDDNFKFSGYIISAMQEYAELWHTAKMQEVTDDDIEKMAFSSYPDSTNMRVAYMVGAKDVRDGEIKHK